MRLAKSLCTSLGARATCQAVGFAVVAAMGEERVGLFRYTAMFFSAYSRVTVSTASRKCRHITSYAAALAEDMMA